MSDAAEVVESSMLGGLQSIRLPRCRHERPEREHWEATRLCSMRALLNDGDVIYDVGSEMGDLSALYALWGCEVVLCEPNPASWPWARLTFEANDVKPMETWWGFVSDQDNWPDPSRGITFDLWPSCSTGPLDPETGFLTEHERGGEFPSITIDTMVSSMRIAPPDAITVDTESYELEAMLGASETLAEHKPLVWLSIHDSFLSDRGRSESDVLDVMKAADYVSRYLGDDHESHWLFIHESKADELWPR